MSEIRTKIMKARFSRSQEEALIDILDVDPTPAGPPQELVGAGAITVTEYATNIETDGADAFTMADGTAEGQRKLVTCVVYVGDATITPANMANGTAVVLAAVDDSVEFVWGSAGWSAVALTGTAVITP